jgi:hypothetical protein
MPFSSEQEAVQAAATAYPSHDVYVVGAAAQEQRDGRSLPRLVLAAVVAGGLLTWLGLARRRRA